tara:strand:+ start:534 stop:998 length:465 start_codon:yes stop_codon:yes gene_type:complete
VTAAALWTTCKSNYDTQGLVELTNIRDRTATTIDDTVGEAAAQAVINLWPIYTQVDYDSTSALHVEIAMQGVISLLYRRGGASTQIEQVRWESVWDDEGLMGRLRKTNVRGRKPPKISGNIKASRPSRQSKPWSDSQSLPVNYLPRQFDQDDPT